LFKNHDWYLKSSSGFLEQYLAADSFNIFLLPTVFLLSSFQSEFYYLYLFLPISEPGVAYDTIYYIEYLTNRILF